MNIVSNMNYNCELKIDEDLFEGTLDIDGNKYQVWFDYKDISFEAEEFSQGEGSISFRMFAGNTVYQLLLELEEEGQYFGELREIERVSGMPEKILLTKEIQLRIK